MQTEGQRGQEPLSRGGGSSLQYDSDYWPTPWPRSACPLQCFPEGSRGGRGVLLLEHLWKVGVARLTPVL